MTVIERVPGRYDRIGVGYQQTRREDPRLAARIHAALGSARSVVNIGAGTGSYEPRGRTAIAVEPSAVMIAQRPVGAAPTVRAVAEVLPFGGQRFDAAMALWTLHHWADPGAGIAELRRVARRVVLVTASERLNELWLIRDYFPAMAWRRPEIQLEHLAARLGGTGSGGTGSSEDSSIRVEPLLVPRDCVDGFAEAYWARPEAYLDPQVRAGMSSFGILSEAETRPGLRRLEADLRSGAWDARNGALRELPEHDCGLRLITATDVATA
jgi:SAM-dependent methyltransferase